MHAAEFLTELFDKDIPWVWTVPNSAKFEITKDDKTYIYEVDFEPEPTNERLIHVNFLINDNGKSIFDSLKTGTAFTVYATVSKIIYEYVQNNGSEIDALLMNGYELKQTKLYLLMANKLKTRLPGWHVELKPLSSMGIMDNEGTPHDDAVVMYHD